MTDYRIYLFIAFILVLLFVLSYIYWVTRLFDKNLDEEYCNYCLKVTYHHWGLCTQCHRGRSHLRGR